jgi:hypothetical protein
MNKTKLVLVGTIIAALCFASFVYALTTLSWTQNPQVTTGSFTAYYETTPILQGSDQTSIWKWDGTTSSFTTTIKIKNDGQSNINVYVACTLEPSSNWIASGFGRQDAIAIGETRQVELGITNTEAQSGDFVGSFTITMTIAP